MVPFCRGIQALLFDAPIQRAQNHHVAVRTRTFDRSTREGGRPLMSSGDRDTSAEVFSESLVQQELIQIVRGIHYLVQQIRSRILAASGSL